MIDIVPAEGAWLDQVLDASYEIWHEGLTRAGYARWYEAQRRTRWGCAHLGRFAMVEGGVVLSSAKQYDFDAVLDDRPVRVAGIGAVFTDPAHRGRGHARTIVEQLLERAAADGFDFALLFSEIGADYYGRLGFQVIPTFDRLIHVAGPERRDAPATLVRAGGDRDLAAIAELGRARSRAYRFHLDRDSDLVQYAIAKKRLLAGLGPAGARALQFLVTEEADRPVAYLVVSAADGVWTIEECGDRDPAGARVGAMLQALIARDAVERRPTIHGWLPERFVPAQVIVAMTRPSAEVMMVRGLRRPTPELASEEVLWWKGDVF